MKTLNKYVGLDVHKDTTVIAAAEAGRAGEVRLYGTISRELLALDRARSTEKAHCAASQGTGHGYPIQRPGAAIAAAWSIHPKR